MAYQKCVRLCHASSIFSLLINFFEFISYWQGLKFVNYFFAKSLHHRCSTGFYMRVLLITIQHWFFFLDFSSSLMETKCILLLESIICHKEASDSKFSQVQWQKLFYRKNKFYYHKMASLTIYILLGVVKIMHFGNATRVIRSALTAIFLI